MSVYTTQLRYICEQYAGRTMSADYRETPAVIAAALPKLFDFDFPLYDPTYKRALETKIVNHYYFREIGAETTAQFKFMLSRTLNEIMPYYNELYKSADLQFNPFYDVDYFRDHKGKDSEKRVKEDRGTSTTSSTENGQTSDNTQFTGTVETETSGNRNTTINSESTRTLNTSDQTTYNSTDTKTLGTTDTKTLNTKDTVRNSETPQGALTGIENNKYLSSASITDKTGTETLGRTGTESGRKTGTDTLARTGTDATVTEETQAATEGSTSAQESGSTTTAAGTSSTTTSGSGATTNNGTEDINGTDEYLDHVYGKMGGATYAALLTEYRETLINIDMMIINDLEVCFMNLY